MQKSRYSLQRITAFLQHVPLPFLHRGAHHFDQKLVHAAGVPVFPEHGVPQVVEALDDNAVLFGGEVEFEFSSFHAIASLVPLLYLGQWPYASVSFPL